MNYYVTPLNYIFPTFLCFVYLLLRREYLLRRVFFLGVVSRLLPSLTVGEEEGDSVEWRVEGVEPEGSVELRVEGVELAFS